jgi:alpha-L-fucosidase
MFLRFLRFALFAGIVYASFTSRLPAQISQDVSVGSLNKPERLEWFRNQGFGIFIHWSVDGQIGTVISHSLVDASPEYADKFFEDLPKTFYPEKFNADAIARLARLSGARYMVFTTKHHSGFTMFSSATTSFGVMNTPFHRDISGELYAAFRKQGLATGVYLSPDDFYWLHKNLISINRSVPSVLFKANPGLLKYDQQQLTELMTHYGPIGLVFFDGEYQGLRELAWKLQPDTIVTRGAIETPEQYVPGTPLPGAWEANITMGTAWQYQPQHEIYKTGPDLIHLLIQTRARGGNLLLNIGPKPDGEIPIEQEERLREIGLWMFVNSESIYNVRPWNITNENDVWFTSSKSTASSDGTTLYAIVDRPWKRGTFTDVVLQSVRTTKQTQISVLGQNSKVYEYQPQTDPTPTWSQQPDGLHIRAMRTQRLQDNSAWPNPAVLRITHVEQAFTPPQLHTLPFESLSGNLLRLHGEWTSSSSFATVQVGFEYRAISGEDKNARTAPWVSLPLVSSPTPGQFTAETSEPRPGIEYEFRAVVKHPLLTIYGEVLRIPQKR